MDPLLQRALEIANRSRPTQRPAPRTPEASLRPKPGQWVEWRSPALPNSLGEVLDLGTDEAGAASFLVYHSRTEVLRWLPVAWIVRVFTHRPDAGSD